MKNNENENMLVECKIQLLALKFLPQKGVSSFMLLSCSCAWCRELVLEFAFYIRVTLK